MRLLIDTNIVIPLEPTSHADVKADTSTAASLVRLSLEGHHQINLHPAGLQDLARDKQPDRMARRLKLLEKYTPLPSPPPIAAVEAVVGCAAPGSNNWVDHFMLAAVLHDAVDVLVTNDDGVHRKARRLGVSDRVMTLEDAVQMLQGLGDRTPPPPPAVRATVAHEISDSDPILDGLRQDYAKFDVWFANAKRQHRMTWIVSPATAPTTIAGFCLVKHEKDDPFGLPGKVLKICTFKVSEKFFGRRYGELLLKPVFDYAWRNEYGWAFVTAFEKQTVLLTLLGDFGFEVLPDRRTAAGELVLAKPMRASTADRAAHAANPLTFQIRYGPNEVSLRGAPAAVVPIQPRYHDLLFPELARQSSLFAGLAEFGNSLRKAYLCHAPTRQLRPGSCLFFYRSQDEQTMRAIGVVEETLVSSDAAEVVRYVAKRTVYSAAEIGQLVATGPVLCILFRQARSLTSPIALAEAQEAGVLSSAPQSIQAVPEGGIAWLETRVQA